MCCAKEPIFRPAKLRILARAVTNFANRLGFDCLAPRCRPTKVKKKERFGQPIMGAKYYCSCHEYAFRSLRKCEPNLLRRRRRNERCRPPGNQRGDRSQASQSNWPRCKRSAISFEKPKPAKACTDRLTRRPVQYENRRSACPFLTERLASAVVGLAPPKFLRGGRDFGILENFRIWSAQSRWLGLLAASTAIQLFQSKLKRFRLGNQPCRKLSGNSFVKRPKFVGGH